MVLQTWFIMSGILVPKQTNLHDLPPGLLLHIIWMMGFDPAVVALTLFSSNDIHNMMIKEYPYLLYHLFVVRYGGQENAMKACVEPPINASILRSSEVAGIGLLRYIVSLERVNWPCDAPASEFAQAMTLGPEKKIRMESKPSRQGVLAAIEGRRSDDVVMFMLTMYDVVWGPDWPKMSLIDIFLDKAKECGRLELHVLMSEKRRNALRWVQNP